MENNQNIQIFPPEGYEIDTTDVVDNSVIVTFKKKNKKLPKSWEEFCAFYPLTSHDCYISKDSSICSALVIKSHTARQKSSDRNLLPDFIIAEAICALCQLIQLRDCYNQGWQPDWSMDEPVKIIQFVGSEIDRAVVKMSPHFLYFKNGELRDLFLENFHPLIEKLKPLYGIKKGGTK